MVKSVLSVAHIGLKDWVIQRLSAVYMAVYSVALFLYIACHPGLSFADWHALFTYQSVKITSVLFLFLLLYHAWIGIWTVFTDYVKNFVVRAVLNTLVLLIFFACFVWGILILWSV